MQSSVFGEWLRRHEVAAWLGVAVGIAQIAAGPGLFGWASPVGIALVVCGSAIAGGILVYYFRTPPRYPVRALVVENDYVLEGPRGAKASRTERTQFRANADLTSFVYALKKRPVGGSETLRFRKLPAATPDDGWIDLKDRQHIFPAAAPDGKTSYTLQPPLPITRGETFEVWDHLEINDAFPDDDEYVGKNLIYPTDRLSFKIEYGGCNVRNCLGTRFELRTVGGEALQIKPSGNKSLVYWSLRHCKAGVSYRISWTWVL